MTCPIPAENNFPATPEDVFAVLHALGVPYALFHHPAVFTVAESEGIEMDIPGGHCRNLFLRNKKEAMFLVSALNETRIDLKKLGAALDAGRFSFGSPERLWTYLGVRPGSVCPYAVMNDYQGAVTAVLDAAIMTHEVVNFHPLVNTMTIGVSPAGLLTFMSHFGHKPLVLDMTALAPDIMPQE